MYKPEDLSPELLRVCPTALPCWEEHLEWWGLEERDIYKDLTELACHIVDSVRVGNIGGFEAFFSLVETLLKDGDEDINGLSPLASSKTFRLLLRILPLPAVHRAMIASLVPPVPVSIEGCLRATRA